MLETIFADLIMTAFIGLSVLAVVTGLMRDHQTYKAYKKGI
jgi:hypothetical protein